MPSFATSKLAVRFVRWVVAISFLITLAGICLATYLEYRHDLRHIREQIQGIDTFVPTLSASVWRLDDSQIDLQLQGIEQLPAVDRAAVIIDGQLAYQTSLGAIDLVADSEPRYPLSYESGGIVHELGELVVQVNRAYATDRVQVRFLEIAAIQLARGIVIAIVILLIFRHLVGRRLKALSSDIRCLNWGNLQSRPVRLERGVKDELSEVRETLESMRVKITEGIEREKEAEAQLEYRRLFDPVTGLPNRLLLKDRLETFRRSSGDLPIAVVAVELMRLSELDTMLSSSALHQALRLVASSLQELVEPSGIVSRYSERRFVIVIGPVHKKRDVDKLVTDIAALFDKPFVSSPDQNVFFSAAYGVVLTNESEEEADSSLIVSRALRALDSAMSHGHGSRSYWGEHLRMNEGSTYQQIRSALNHNAFDLYCQPIFDLGTSEVVSLECLIRWHAERLSTYGIEASVRVLEQSGLSGALDRAVLNKAVELWERLPDGYAGRIAINLTARSFADREFGDYIDSLPAGFLEHLELELTETSVPQDLRAARALATKLRERSVHLVLDDFGTGFSSIEYLSHFQFHTIKIDRSFFRQGLRNQRRLLRAMVSIAHGVGSKVVAEGIEESWQLEMVQGLEMDYIQGFIHSEPLPEEKILEFLKSRQQETA